MYQRKRYNSVKRLIILIEEGELKVIDAWGNAQKMPSRTETVKYLIKKGLEAENAKAEK